MLSTEQRGVLVRISAALALTFVTLTVAVVWPPEILLPSNEGQVALVAALQWDALLALALLVSIMRLAKHRFFSPEDISGGGAGSGTQRAQQLQAILQNTLEQVVLAVLVHAVWAVTMPRSWQAAIPTAVTLFVIGRVLFTVGYARGAPGRALGFALTFYPTGVMLLSILLRLAVSVLPAAS